MPLTEGLSRFWLSRKSANDAKDGPGDHIVWPVPAPEARFRFWKRAGETQEPRLSYVVYFTARSGSTRLADVATRAGGLGQPSEIYNPAFVPDVAASLGARDLDEYVFITRRHLARDGVFGTKVTHGFIERTFPGPEAFMEYFGDSRSFWLIREDIVAQAVSLAKMARTGVAHSSLSSAEDRARSDASFDYQPEEIRHWLRHIAEMETQTESMFRKFGIKPKRLSYERLSALSNDQLSETLASHIGCKPRHPIPDAAVDSKIGTAKNMEFAERFRAEHGALMARMDVSRRAMLRELDPL